jgi:hypothetical protein
MIPSVVLMSTLSVTLATPVSSAAAPVSGSLVLSAGQPSPSGIRRMGSQVSTYLVDKVSIEECTF